MRRLLVPLLGVVVGVVAVLAVAAWIGADDDPPPTTVELTFPPVEHDPEAAEDLVVAWQRWRTSSFVTSGVWSRTLDGSDDPLKGDTYTAQEPPRRLVVRLGAVLERIDNSVVQCDAPAEDQIVPGCTEVDVARSYDERVTAEMTLVLAYVIGDQRLYDVARDGNCFQVELVEAALRSPWGRAAEFCFHEATGALASSRVRRQSAVDLEITSTFRSDVTDADF